MSSIVPELPKISKPIAKRAGLRNARTTEAESDDHLGPRTSPDFKRHPPSEVLLEDRDDSKFFVPMSKKAKLRGSDANVELISGGDSSSSSAPSTIHASLTSSRPLRLSGGQNTAPAGLFVSPTDKVDAIRASTAPFKFNLATAGGTTVTRSKLQALIGKDNEKMKHKEDDLRESFVKDRNNFTINDPHVHLIDVFKTRDAQWKHQRETPEEAAIPKLLTRHLPRVVNENEYAVVDLETFKMNFAELTNNVFKDMKDWNNVLVAGGAVLGALMNISDRSAFQDTDGSFYSLVLVCCLPACLCVVDLFLYGLTEEQATQKLKDIYFVVQAATKATCQIIRTKHAVTILGQYPTRHVQIVLRLYKSPSEILMGFDIDSCCVGFDGTTVWALPRAKRAICKRYNLVDMSRRSLSYEARLYKYSKRGFAVAVPGLQRFLIDPSLYTKRPSEVHGLAKLILFDHEANTKVRAKFEPWQPPKQRYQIYSCDEFSEHIINEFETIVLLQQAYREHETTHKSVC